MDQPPGRVCGEGAYLRGLPSVRPKLSEIATYMGRYGRISHPWIFGRLYWVLREILIKVGGSRIRLRPSMRRTGEIHGRVPSRSAEIQRNRPAMGAIGRGLAPRGSGRLIARKSFRMSAVRGPGRFFGDGAGLGDAAVSYLRPAFCVGPRI